jgi:hypothetical protein
VAEQVRNIANHDQEHFGQLAALKAAWDKRPKT